jgi:hypothetical protein
VGFAASFVGGTGVGLGVAVGGSGVSVGEAVAVGGTGLGVRVGACVAEGCDKGVSVGAEVSAAPADGNGALGLDPGAKAPGVAPAPPGCRPAAGASVGRGMAVTVGVGAVAPGPEQAASDATLRIKMNNRMDDFLCTFASPCSESQASGYS